MVRYRSYQIEAVEKTAKSFEEYPNDDIIIALPTGTGKSLVIAGLAQYMKHHYPWARMIVATHVKELVRQNHKALIRAWPTAPAGIYSAGLKRRDTNLPIIFAGIDSVSKRAAEFKYINLLVIDEAHLVSPKDSTRYARFICDLRKTNPNLRVVGLSATPYRLGTGSLIDGEHRLFQRIAYDLTDYESFDMFLNEGYLAPLTTKPTTTEIDVSELKVVAGEYEQKGVSEAVDEILHSALRECLVAAADRNHWLIFAASLDNCQRISECLDLYGVSNVVVHSKLSDEERDRNINLFLNKKVRVAINLNVLTTGFDAPFIDCIVCLRPTKSTGLWVQMLGRGTRPDYAIGYDLLTREGRLLAISNSNKSNCLVLDFAGNRRRLGPINDPIIPSKKGKKKRGGDAPIRTCDVCGTSCHARRTLCPFCGYEFPINVKISRTAESMEVMKTRYVEFEVTKPNYQVTWFDVDSVQYDINEKKDTPSSLIVYYHCGLRRFREWVCLDHSGYPFVRAKKWWRDRYSGEIQAIPSVHNSMNYTDGLKRPKKIQVKLYDNPKTIPEVLDYEY